MFRVAEPSAIHPVCVVVDDAFRQLEGADAHDEKQQVHGRMAQASVRHRRARVGGGCRLYFLALTSAPPDVTIWATICEPVRGASIHFGQPAALAAAHERIQHLRNSAGAGGVLHRCAGETWGAWVIHVFYSAISRASGVVQF